MIMIRSNPGQKINKPPPPVPPRPSKTLVQEALAKTRQHNDLRKENKTVSPVRAAPPPPIPISNGVAKSAANTSEIFKSNSSYTVNVKLKKPLVYERSLSEEHKSSRPVVYQSSNCASNNMVNISRNDSLIQKNCEVITETCFQNVEKKTSACVRRVDSFKIKEPQKVQVLKTGNCFQNGGNNVSAAVRRMDSFGMHDPQKVQITKNESDEDKHNFDKECKGNGFDNPQQEIYNNTDNCESKSKESTLEKSTSSKTNDKTGDSCSSSSSSKSNSLDKKWDKMLDDRNHVNTLIDEMFASVLEVNVNSDEDVKISDDKISDENKIIINNKVDEDISYNNVTVNNNVNEKVIPTTVIVIKDETGDHNNENKSQSEENKSNTSTSERKVTFSDQMNAELLINELQHMKMDQEKILKRQRKPSMNIYDSEGLVKSSDKIKINDWMSVSDCGKETKLSTCQITIEDVNKKDEMEKNGELDLDYERITKMSHLHGLPPLPKSLSGFNLLDHQPQHPNPPTPIRSSSIRTSQGQPGTPGYSPHPKVNGDGSVGRKSTSLDTQLAILRREMYSLRQQDLSLLSQLWSLNESIQDFRQILQDQEDRVLSPPSPSPTPSSADEEEFYMSSTSVGGFRSTPRLPGRRMSGSSGASGSVG